MTRMTPRGLQLAFALSCTLVSHERLARAEPPEPTGPAGGTRPYLLTIRANAGLGTGQLGVAGRAALSGEGWFSDHFGAGAFWGTSGQGGSLDCIFCPAGNETLQFVGATLAARTAPRGSYGLLVVGAAYAWGRYWVTGGFDFGVGPTSQPPVDSRAGILGSLSGAWLFHVDGFETGPVLVADVSTWGSVMLTGNWALGFAL